jgi:CheY-like chemotaxis protein
LSLFRDGKESIEFLNRRGVFTRAPKPDVILLDLFLPDAQGVDILRQLRADPEIADIPVVILTSSDDYTDQHECERLGVSSYIHKPFNEEKFLSVIRRLKGLAVALEAAAIK